MSCSVRTNESKFFNWYDFVMPYVIITFRRVIFSDASTSGFKSELILRSLLQLSWQFSMLFFKVLMWNVFTRCKIVLWYRFRQKWELKITEVWIYCFAPSEIYLYKFCKAFQQKSFHQIMFILWFFGMKTCKDDSYLQKENLFIKKIH